MRQLWIALALILTAGLNLQAQKDSLNIYYFENPPYAFTERTANVPGKGQPRGIEIEIVQEYIQWLKQKKGIQVYLNFTLFTDFSNFYNSVKNGRPSVLGLGSVTRNAEREKEVQFSAPYLLNQAVLISHGSVSSVREKTTEQINKVLGDMRALTVAGSSHEVYLKELKTDYLNSLKITYASKPNSVLDSISSNKKVIGYSDLVSYWTYLKSNPSKLLKMQKALSGIKEELGFIFPKNSSHGVYLNEFFESGFGFTSTKVYKQILEAHLGYEILEYVEVN